MKIKITGVGSYIPEIKIANTDFSEHVFLNEDGSPFGERHLNGLGNALIGDLMSEQILKQYALPLKEK